MIKRLFFLLMPLLMLTILAERILRERYSRNELLFRTEREGGGIKIESAIFLSNVPGDWREIVGGVQWLRHNNEQGLRENYELPCGSMPPGADRVVVALGDSWMYGFGLTQNQTLPDMLGSALSDEGERVEVVNAGVIGGSAFDELMSWTALSYCLPNIDGVLIGVPHNLNRQQFVNTSGKRHRWLATHRQTQPIFPNWYGYLGMRHVLMRFRVPPIAQGMDGDAQHMDMNAQHDVATIVTQARFAHIPVWIVDWPANWEEKITLRTARFTQVIEDLARSMQVPLSGHAFLDRSCWGAHDTAHPSPAGAHAIAQTITPMMRAGLDHTQQSWSQPTHRSTLPLCSDLDQLR